MCKLPTMLEPFSKIKTTPEHRAMVLRHLRGAVGRRCLWWQYRTDDTMTGRSFMADLVAVDEEGITLEGGMRYSLDLVCSKAPYSPSFWFGLQYDKYPYHLPP